MEVLVLDGKNYVKATKAARDLGYASDYVGQLCRTKQIDAHLIGRTWYVNQDQLGNHRVEKRRMARTKAREQAKKAIEEVHRLRVEETRDAHEHKSIRYERDDGDLIPATRKLAVQAAFVGTLPTDENQASVEPAVLNKGEKILMSGDLTVVDVTDTPIETDTVILTPRKIRTARTQEIPLKRGLKDARDAIVPTQPKTFDQKLQERIEASQTTTPVVVTEGEPVHEETAPAASSRIPYVLFLTVVLFASLATVPYRQAITYTSPSDPTLISYEFALSEIVSVIRSKI